MKLEYLKAKWQGSWEEMYDFATDCLRFSERYPFLGLVMVEALEEIHHWGSKKDENYLGRSDVWPTVDGLRIPIFSINILRTYNGTTKLFAALIVSAGLVIEACMKRHRHQEWIKFLEKIDASPDPSLDLHLVADNYATHKHPKVKRWLAKHPRFYMHFTPTSSSWLNLVERWFREITQKRLRRGTFRSVRELIEAIVEYVEAHNEQAQGMFWKALPDEILAKVRRARAVLDKTPTA